MGIQVLSLALVMKFRWTFFVSFQAIRVLGLLGALDPYKHKVNIGMIDQSRDASAVSLSESKSSQDSCKHLNFFQIDSFMIYKQILTVLLPVCLLFLKTR